MENTGYQQSNAPLLYQPLHQNEKKIFFKDFMGHFMERTSLCSMYSNEKRKISYLNEFVLYQNGE